MVHFLPWADLIYYQTLLKVKQKSSSFNFNKMPLKFNKGYEHF